jgi:hypothetical protein
MSLRLVSVEGEPVQSATLADELQAFTDNVEGNALGVISVVVLNDGNLRIAWCGEDYSNYELIGFFEAAKFRVIADDALGGD